MTDPFILTVDYKSIKTDFTAQLILQGYTHKFSVLINDMPVYFEPDEEGSYRAVQMPGQDEKALALLDRKLLALIGQELAAILS
ncbi:MAG: hypothetical protein QM726_17430 [Chitinophagaceae bacterium]